MEAPGQSSKEESHESHISEVITAKAEAAGEGEVTESCPTLQPP